MKLIKGHKVQNNLENLLILSTVIAKTIIYISMPRLLLALFSFVVSLVFKMIFCYFKRSGAWRLAETQMGQVWLFSLMIKNKEDHINKEDQHSSICDMPFKKSLKQSEILKSTMEKSKWILETTVISSPKHLNQYIKPQLPSECTFSINSALNLLRTNAEWLDNTGRAKARTTLESSVLDGVHFRKKQNK